MTLKDYYKILGLQPNASLADVKQAYRQLAKTWHPDRFAHNLLLRQEAEEKIKQINEAYQRLKDYDPVFDQSSPINSTVRSSVSSQPLVTAVTYYDRGAANVQAGQYKEALSDFSMAIRLNPNYAEAYRYRGFVNSLLGFELGAEADLQKAKQLGLQSKQSDTTKPSPTKGAASAKEPVSSPPQRTPQAAQLQPWSCVQTLAGSRSVPIAAIAINRDGKILASGGGDGTIELWNLRTGKPFCSLSGHSGAIRAVNFSADGQWLVSAGQDRSLKLWHLQTGSLGRTFNGHQDEVLTVAFSPDRRWLASGSADGSVCIWNLASGLLSYSLLAHDVPTRALIFTPDSSLLISGGDEHIRIYQARAGELYRTLSAQAEDVLALVMRADQKYFASSGRNGQIHLWEDRSIVTGSPIGAFIGHTGAVQTLAFSPDGQSLASGGSDRTIKLWSMVTRELLANLEGHTDTVTAIAYQPKEQLLLSSSLDTTIKIWKAES